MKKTILNFRKQKALREKITWITAYSFPFAQAAEKAGVDMILVGDSGGMVELGYETTNPVTLDEMISFAKAVRRGAPNTFIVGDFPQGSYEVSDEDAVRTALRFVKEAGCDAIKLEGGRRISPRVKAITAAGILVIGHLGLTPQSCSSFGGYRVQCKDRNSFTETFWDALSLEQAGASMLLLEAMPAIPAEKIARYLNIPVLGIGAGKEVDGQLCICHDLVGFYQSFRPWFAKCYIPEVIESFDKYVREMTTGKTLKDFGRTTRSDGLLHLAYLAIEAYVKDVKEGEFPGPEYVYPLSEAELASIKESECFNRIR